MPRKNVNTIRQKAAAINYRLEGINKDSKKPFCLLEVVLEIGDQIEEWQLDREYDWERIASEIAQEFGFQEVNSHTLQTYMSKWRKINRPKGDQSSSGRSAQTSVTTHAGVTVAPTLEQALNQPRPEPAPRQKPAAGVADHSRRAPQGTIASPPMAAEEKSEGASMGLDPMEGHALSADLPPESSESGFPGISGLIGRPPPGTYPNGIPKMKGLIGRPPPGTYPNGIPKISDKNRTRSLGGFPLKSDPE